jgi:hypothetical protein
MDESWRAFAIGRQPRLQVVEEEVEEEVVPAHLEMYLPPHEGEACAELEQEPRDVLDERSLELKLARLVPDAEEVEAVWILQALASEIGLRLGETLGEVGECLALALDGACFEVVHKDRT